MIMAIPKKKKNTALNAIISEVKAFETAMKKRKTVIKMTDDEIVAAVKKIRKKNALPPKN